MKGLIRYVTKYANDRINIGLELGLELSALDNIETNCQQQVEKCLRKMLDKLLKLNTKATWKTLEVALTNGQRFQLGLDPVTDLCGENVISVIKTHGSVSCGPRSRRATREYINRKKESAIFTPM